MANISIKNVSNVFMSIKKKDDALKKLQEQINSVKDAQKEQTGVIVNKSTRFILEKTRLGSYLKDIVTKTLETGDSEEYDLKLSLIIDGISKVVEDVSNMSSDLSVKKDESVKDVVDNVNSVENNNTNLEENKNYEDKTEDDDYMTDEEMLDAFTEEF